jgi:CLIP-associating protein 1/2
VLFRAGSTAAVLTDDHSRVHLNVLMPAAVELLSNDKQPVCHAAWQLLVTLKLSFPSPQLVYFLNDIAVLSVSHVSSPIIIVERAGNYAWTHKSWKVREEFVRTVAASVQTFRGKRKTGPE